MLLGFEIVDNMDNLSRSLHSDFTNTIVAEFQGNGENVFEDCFRIIDMGKFFQLARYGMPDSPFFWIFLQHQENINQILSSLLLELFNELRQIFNSAEFQIIWRLLEDVIKGWEQRLFWLLGAYDAADRI